MLTKLEQAQKELGGTHKVVDTLLAERKELLVQYCQLAGLPPFEREGEALPEQQSIRSFCEILMDYVSAGHFEVYERIATEENGLIKVAEEIYPQLTETTDEALNFNDAYANDEVDMRNFDLSLSNLGQRMEERFDLEDRLIRSAKALNQ